MPGFSIEPASGVSPTANIDFLRQHRWRVEQLGPIQESELQKLYAKDLQIPEVEVETEIIKGGFLSYKYASGVSYGDATVAFYGTVDLFTKLTQWQAEVFDLEGGIKESNTYKKDSIFILEDGIGTQVQKFTLKNSWLKNISHGPLAMTTSEVVLVTIAVSCDFYEYVGQE